MARSDPRIPYSELRRKALAQGLTDDEIRRYFEVDQRAAERLEFSVKLNVATVRQDGRRPSRTETNDLLRTVDENRRVRELAARAGPAAKSLGPPNRPKILNEGDSWFDLPPVLKPRDAMDFLRGWFNIDPLAKWSAKLADIVRDKQYVQKLQAGTGYDMFMFSASGNDILASLANCLNQRKPGDDDPANAADYVNSQFSTALNRAMQLYGQMIVDVRSVQNGSKIVIFLHGYSNAIPRKSGKYLGRHLQAKGFDPTAQRALCKAIITHMIGSFNNRLKALADNSNPAVYVDLRATVTDSDWNTDEIHPNDAGAEKIAKELRNKINAVWASA